METEEFNFNLPKKLIAQSPARPRDYSKLMALDRKTGKITYQFFYQVEKFLKPGDVLVLNNSKVIPARLWGRTHKSQDAGKYGLGRKIEVLLLRPYNKNIWECLLGGRKREVGFEIEFKSGLKGIIKERLEDGIWRVQFNLSRGKLKEKIKKSERRRLHLILKRKVHFLITKPFMLNMRVQWRLQQLVSTSLKN